MKILIVVDMQHDFIDGALGSPEARSIVDAVIYKIDKRISEGYKVIYTKDTHYTDYLETQEGRHLPVAHCIKDTPGWNIPEKLWREGAVVIEKNGFGSWKLAETLAKEKDIESIELIGLCTDICVINNALLLKARIPEVPVYVDASCCAGVTKESHHNALNAMKQCQINIINEQQ